MPGICSSVADLSGPKPFEVCLAGLDGFLNVIRKFRFHVLIEKVMSLRELFHVTLCQTLTYSAVERQSLTAAGSRPIKPARQSFAACNASCGDIYVNIRPCYRDIRDFVSLCAP